MATPPEVVITRLLDTSTISNWMRNPLQGTVEPYLQPPGSAAISFQTLAELLVWTTSPTLPPGYRRQVLDFISTATVLQSNDDVARHYAAIVRRRISAGRPENPKDAWIAATALAYGLPLITFDRHGFNDIPDLDLTLLRTP